jgi:lipopolysaccharide transport system ATP-binding protein
VSDQAILAESLSKRYRIGRRVDPARSRTDVARMLLSPFAYLASTLRDPSEDETFWALREVSFAVKSGEALGVIGPNGAGKSTLLKILARITEPTSGRAILNGRVGSLLEVGTGFHPELTGRENIYLSGAILGMKRAEIERKFDEIVAFAETERFLDTPVKRYSSGMYVRLAFAVAAHLEPEILLVDEVLAVGDAAFQKKCLGKMGDVTTQGRTVLFVSHNMVAIQSLCSRAIWLDHGGIVRQGEANQVVTQYLASGNQAVSEQVWPEMTSAPGNDKVRLRRVCVYPENGSPNDPITMETAVVIEVEYWNLVPDQAISTTLHFYSEQMVVAFTSSPIDAELDEAIRPKPTGLFREVCTIPGNLLNSGQYRIWLLMVVDAARAVFRLEDCAGFEVLDLSARGGAWYGREPGFVRPILEWKTELLDRSPAGRW